MVRSTPTIVAYIVALLCGQQVSYAEPEFALQGPDSMILGPDTKAEVSVRSQAHDLRFYVNVGSVSPTETRDGRVHAVYRPPVTRFPQVAIIVVASSDRSLIAWKILKLAAQPTIDLESIKHADVVALVGGKSFGPVRTDTKGHARLPIIAPPGLHEVELTTTDRLGRVSTNLMKLGAPNFPKLLTLCPGDGADDMLLFVSDTTGEPDQSAEFEFSTQGRVGEVKRVGPGLWAVGLEKDSAGSNLLVSSVVVGDPLSRSECSWKPPSPIPAMTTSIAKDKAPGTADPHWEAALSLGYATNLGIVSAPRVQAQLGWRTPYWDRSLVVGASLGFYRSENTDSTQVRLELQAIPVVATIHYEHGVRAATIFGGVGAGAVYSMFKISSTQSGLREIRTARPAGGGFLGGRYALGSGYLQLQGGYWLAPIDEPEVSGNLYGLAVDLGYGVGF